MQIFSSSQFGPVQAVKLGWAPVGTPMMCTRCFLFNGVMIDTGQAHMEKPVLDLAKKNKIQQVMLTHHHEDHTGNAAKIKHHCNARVFGHAHTISKMASRFAIFPYQKYIWGKSSPLVIDSLPKAFDTPLGKMVPFHTPGHAKDHMVYLLEDQGILFSGDLYLGDRIRYFRADEDIKRQIDSLKKVQRLDFEMLLCSHNPRIKNGPGHIKKKLGFLEEFYGQIKACADKGMKDREILAHLHLKESLFIKLFCFGNVSMINGIRSVLKSEKTVRS